MTQQQPYGASTLQVPDAQLIKLGQAMKEVQKWWWLGICLFFLIVPPIILFVKYIQYIMALGEVKKVENDQDINNVYIYTLVALVCSLVSGPLFGTGAEFVLSVVGFVFSILAVMAMEKWATTFNQRKQSVNSANFLKAIQDLKTATILMIIIIGIFLYPGAIGRAGDSILAEHGVVGQPNQNTFQRQQTSYNQQPTIQYQPQYSQQTYTSQPATFGGQSNTNNGINTQQTIQPKFCPQCGSQLPPDAKFCGKCGSTL